MKCPRCGLENPDDFKYCHECGTYLAPEFDAYNAKKHQNAYGSQFYGDSELFEGPSQFAFSITGVGALWRDVAVLFILSDFL